MKFINNIILSEHINIIRIFLYTCVNLAFINTEFHQLLFVHLLTSVRFL